MFIGKEDDMRGIFVQFGGCEVLLLLLLVVGVCAEWNAVMRG
jgi:hypothetical protein